MKKYIKLFLFFIVTSYLIVSFIKWEINPKIWTMNDRGAYVFMLLLLGPLLVMLLKILNDKS